MSNYDSFVLFTYGGGFGLFFYVVLGVCMCCVCTCVVCVCVCVCAFSQHHQFAEELQQQ